jgi:hypothetical protein
MEHADMALTPAELLEKALNGESLDGDDTVTQGNQDNTNGTADGAGTAADTAGQGDEGKTQDAAAMQAQTTGDEPVGAPIASKSGAYTIPYEKLEQARTHAKTLEGENEALRAQVAELTAKQQANLAAAEDGAQSRAEAGQAQTAADQNLAMAKEAIAMGIDPAVFGDFSEEGIAKGIGTVTHQLVSQAEARINERVEKALAEKLAPFATKQAKEASDGHLSAIYQKHPDADEIVQSAEFGAWLKSLPSFSRAAVQGVLDPKTGGTAAEVVEVFDTFKAQTGKAAPAPRAQGDGKAPEVQRRVPNSLSEAAGEQHQDVTQQVMASAGTDPNALMERMQDMTPEQIERVLNSI